MNQEQLTFYVPLGICLVLFSALFLATPKEDGEPTRWSLLLAWLSRYVPQPAAVADDDRVSPRGNAEMEMAEMGNAPAVDLAAVRREALAEAVGTLTGAGFIAPDQRSKALLRLGIQGRRYTELKPKVDAAQAAAQLDLGEEPEAPEPPRAVRVYEGRPDERLVEL